MGDCLTQLTFTFDFPRFYFSILVELLQWPQLLVMTRHVLVKYDLCTKMLKSHSAGTLLITKVSPTLVYSLAHLYRYTRTLNSIYSNSAGGLYGHTSSAGNEQHFKLCRV